MKLNDLISELKRFYANKGIDNEKNRPRFNALKKIVAFYIQMLESNNPEIDEVFKYSKDNLKVAYAQMMQKKLNAAEEQVFNDLYSVYSKIIVDESN